ncbi:MAG: T9SS type A sorting domain-containing protein, partial [Bacteroidota bacterium]
FLGSGNYCDYPGNTNGCSTGSCIVVGERNAVWYSFGTNASGNIAFTLTPNSPVDYDWALYDVTGQTNGCSAIAAGTIAPVRCSYWGGTGPTGMSATGTETCDGTSGTLDGWANILATTANKQYLLFVSNYSLTTFVGYSINFGTSPINYNQSNTLTWTGAAGTNWSNSNNWGGCSLPDCSKDVLIYGGPSAQPVIPDNTVISCRNLSIQAGATLTFGQNCTLNICGSYVNNGLLNMPATSTIQFQNSAAQTVDGNMTGANKFGNFTVVKTGGTLSFLQDADIGGNFTVNSSASTTTFNGKHIKLAGDFANPSATLTIPLSSTLEFTGGNNQTYNQGPLYLKQQNVIANKTGGIVSLQTDLNIDVTGSLNLTSGIIYTSTFKTYVANTMTNSITGGNINSYIDGELMRAMDGTTSAYNFQVGKIGKGYELATVAYTNATNISLLSAKFNPWTTVPLGPATNDCGGANYGLLQLFNAGYWTFTSTPTTPLGNYNMTIYPTGQTNAGINPGTTIVKSTNSGTTWGLDGVCVTSSNASIVSRSLMSGFGQFAIGQTSAPLPIELLSFTGSAHEKFNLLEWVTATEKNNDYFTVEKSSDALSFQWVGVVKGAGNSNVPISYSLKDHHPVNGITYYRLMQTDFDGTTTNSSIIAINRKNKSCMISAYPNPSNGQCEVTIETTDKGNYTVYLIDVIGKEVYRESIIIDKEEYHHQFNMSDYKGGIYNCILENEDTNERVNVRLIKQ